jgi:phage tail-like protein
LELESSSTSPAGSAATFRGNSQRFDPYKSYRFLVLMDGHVVAGMSKMSGLKRSSDVIKYRAGGDAGSTFRPGRVQWEAITLERGVTHDTGFESWAQAAESAKTSGHVIGIEMLDETGHPVASYSLHRAWVSEYQALPDLDAGANAVAIEHIKLENEGWEQDTTAPEPKP